MKIEEVNNGEVFTVLGQVGMWYRNGKMQEADEDDSSFKWVIVKKDMTDSKTVEQGTEVEQVTVINEYKMLQSKALDWYVKTRDDRYREHMGIIVHQGCPDGYLICQKDEKTV